MRGRARDRIEGALTGIATAALVGALACSAQPKKDVDVPLDTTVLTSGPVDTSGLTVDGPGRVARTEPGAERSGALADADGARSGTPTESVRRDARDAERRDSDRDSDRKDSDKKKKKKGKKSH